MHLPKGLPQQRHGRTELLIRSWSALFAAAALILMYGPSLFAHIHSSANPFIFGDDARQWVVRFVVSDYGAE
jgi:hypothetical protein